MGWGPIVVDAPAKVNLYLGVGVPRDDGYHDVTTVLQTLAFGDEVSLKPATGLSIECSPPVDIPDEQNLVYRAASAFAQACERDPDVRVSVLKRIPAGAGLAGGSSDAAAVIAGLAHVWRIAPGDRRLVDTAASLGSDVPFFLKGGTALYTGRGDRFVSRLPFVPMHVALVWPGRPVPTADAYAAFDRMHHPPSPGPEGVVAACASGDVRRVAASLYNNLTDASVGLVAEIADAIAWCRQQEGVLGTAMAGSGSGVFSVCESADRAMSLAEEARRQGLRAAASQTTSGGVRIGGEEVA